MTAEPTITNVRIALDLSCGHTVYADKARTDLLTSKGKGAGGCEHCRTLRDFILTAEQIQALEQNAQAGQMTNGLWVGALVARIRELEADHTDSEKALIDTVNRQADRIRELEAQVRRQDDSAYVCGCGTCFRCRP